MGIRTTLALLVLLTVFVTGCTTSRTNHIEWPSLLVWIQPSDDDPNALFLSIRKVGSVEVLVNDFAVVNTCNDAVVSSPDIYSDEDWAFMRHLGETAVQTSYGFQSDPGCRHSGWITFERLGEKHTIGFEYRP